MPQIEFKYSAGQQYQVDAVNAICNLFRGQEFITSTFTAEMNAAIADAIAALDDLSGMEF